MTESKKTRWYKDAVIYQIYPRSFVDSDGDGIGDIRGIISKLDYIKDLGATAVWLSPCYKSPNDDNGYDISDYRDIMDEFGTLDDWKEMLAGLHERGIKLLMDLVVNHTSDEHEWFKQSRSSVDNPYRDYYFWRKGRGKDGKKPPNNWTSRFGGSAWEYDAATGEWYLHLFTKKQPDLNWDNPKVRKEVHDLVAYWLDLGVDGFRCDVITYISKVAGLPNGRFNPIICGDEMFTHGPHIHEYLSALNTEVISRYDAMTVGEAAGVTIEQGLLYTAESRGELDMVFEFEHILSEAYFSIFPKKFNLKQYKAIMSKWQDGMRGKGWNSLYLENHDQPRALGRCTGNYGGNRKEASKMLAVALNMLQGTPYIYQGQEIGMTNCDFAPDEYQDVMVKTIFGIVKKYVPFLKPIALKIMKEKARDNARTPMQWDASENAGFTTGAPWLKINPNHTEINVAEAEKDPDSILNFYKKLNRFRVGNEIVKLGSYRQFDRKNKNVYCYERVLDGKKLLVVCNFKNAEIPFAPPECCAGLPSSVVLHNYPDARSLTPFTLKPYEAVVFEVELRNSGF
ncbi:MAG: alpha-glucosidase [Clostridiales bacterium]|jgi:oligo-1,6-glucosidase|nr:alpha-glucosidase [Clostridiales bacterium]